MAGSRSSSPGSRSAHGSTRRSQSPPPPTADELRHDELLKQVERTDADLHELHDHGPAGFAGLEKPWPHDPLPAEALLQETTADVAAAGERRGPKATRRQTEALLEALRSENARLRAGIAKNTAASASPQRPPQEAQPSTVGSVVRLAVELAAAYGRGCIGRRALGAALVDEDQGAERRVTVACTVGKQNGLQAHVRGGGRPELTGRLVGTRYDWAASQGALHAASLPGELAGLLKRAGLPLPTPAPEEEEEEPEHSPPGSSPGSPAPASTEWLYVASCSLQVLNMVSSTAVKHAVSMLEAAALDPTSKDAVVGLVALHAEGPALDDDLIHIRALFCANEAAAATLRGRRAAEIQRRRREEEIASRRLNRSESRRFEESSEEELEPFPLDQVLEGLIAPVEPEPEPEKDPHFVTTGVGPPWPCMPGCSCATRNVDGPAGLPNDEDVGKVILGSLNWSLAEDLSGYLQGGGPLLERITGKVRASLVTAHAWWVHPDPAAVVSAAASAAAAATTAAGWATDSEKDDGDHLKRWMTAASAAMAALRVSSSGTANLHFTDLRTVRNKLAAVAAVHEALKLGGWEDTREGQWVAGNDSGQFAHDHPIWEVLSASGDEIAHMIRTQLLLWCGTVVAEPAALSRAMMNAYSAVAGDVYGLSGVELWVVKLEGQDGADSDILTASSLGSAVQIKADLKGCTVPAWLPLLSEESLPSVPEHQPKADWQKEADWGKEAEDKTDAQDKTDDLWSPDVPGERSGHALREY